MAYRVLPNGTIETDTLEEAMELRRRILAEAEPHQEFPYVPAQIYPEWFEWFEWIGSIPSTTITLSRNTNVIDPGRATFSFQPDTSH